MKKSPLQLDAYYFVKVSVEINPHFQATKDMTKEGTMPVADIEFLQANDDKYKWRISLALRNAPDEIVSDPYKYTIQAIAFITVDKSIPEEKMMKLVPINAPALLYPAIREMLHNIQSRGPVPGRHLPAAMFTDLQLTKADVPAATNRLAAQRAPAHTTRQ